VLYAAMCLPLGRLMHRLERPARRGEVERPLKPSIAAPLTDL